MSNREEFPIPAKTISFQFYLSFVTILLLSSFWTSSSMIKHLRDGRKFKEFLENIT